MYIDAKKIEKKRKRGRPPTTGKTPMRSIRVPDNEWEAWSKAADKQATTLVAWIRRACAKALDS